MRDAAVLRREVTLLTSKTSIYETGDYFVRRTLQSLSVSRAKIVGPEWIAYRAHYNSYTSKIDDPTGDVTVYPTRFSTDKFVVRTAPWSCTCRFASSNRLPCRHMFDVAQQVYHSIEFSRTATPSRWSIGDYTTLVLALKTAIEDLDMVRISRVAGRDTDNKSPDTSGTTPRAREVGKIPWVRHQKGEMQVIGAVEKRNAVRAQCDRLIRRLMELGTVAFWAASVDLKEFINGFIGRLDEAIPNSVLVALLASASTSTNAPPRSAVDAPASVEVTLNDQESRLTSTAGSADTGDHDAAVHDANCQCCRRGTCYQYSGRCLELWQQ